MIKKVRAYLNAKAVPILAALSLVLAVFSFSAGYTMGGIDWELNYIALKQACAEELVIIQLEYQARFEILKKNVEQYLRKNRGLSPRIPPAEQARLEI